MDNKLSELKAAAMAATPGPWEWFTSNSMARLSSTPSGKDGDVLSAFRASDGVPCVSVSQHDMAFIAAANPAVVLALLAELEATRKQSQELAKQCGRLGARAAIAERKLAKPIQIVNYDEFFICHVSGASDDYCKGWVDGRNAAARDVVKAGFTVEGDDA